MTERYSVERFCAERREDFYRAHGDWCFCVAWHVPTWDGWGDRTAEQNRGLRERLCDSGEYDGYLLYDGDEPVGWCQVGPRDRLAKLRTQFALEPAPENWAITCFQIHPDHRRRGCARRLLTAVLADLRARGVACVEAFPKRGPDLDVDDLWNGPEAMFLAAGFTVTRDDDARPVLIIEL